MSQIEHRRVATNGLHLNIGEAGAGPLVLLLHGFPESWYSWRHQLPALADAGFHAVAPDMRGYGRSDKPRAIDAYNQVEVVNDIIGLIDSLGYEEAVVIGHDWGAPTAWSTALFHPGKVRAVGALSVPFSPRPDTAPLDMLQQLFKDAFFYQLYFQEPGVAEAEFEADIRTALLKFLFLASGEGDATGMMNKPADADLLSDLPVPDSLPAWLTAADLDYYTEEFRASGFRGPLNYYRNLNLTWRLTHGAPTTIEQPAMFMAGDRDGVILMAAEALKQMPERVPDLRVNRLIPKVGHWTQQEAPDAVNGGIIEFLTSLD